MHPLTEEIKALHNLETAGSMRLLAQFPRYSFSG